MTATAKVYPHYYKDVTKFTHIDVYRVLSLYQVTNPCIQHAVKKLLVAGGRGAKDASKDIDEAIASLQRWKAMREEESVTTSSFLGGHLALDGDFDPEMSNNIHVNVERKVKEVITTVTGMREALRVGGLTETDANEVADNNANFTLGRK